MTDTETDFKDRTSGLLAFGILQIIIGAFAALTVPIMVLSMVFVSRASEGVGTSATMMIPSILIYLLAAIWFIWMGIGSIKAKRWARSLILVASSFWLISGIMALIMMMLMLPTMYDQINASGQLPEAMITIMQYGTFGFMLILYVILPGGLVLFYRSKHVKATCEHKDPNIPWTDRCPMPVLAITIATGCGALCMPISGLYGWALPCFGSISSGTTGIMIALFSMLILGYIAWGTYRLKLSAWWCALGMVFTYGSSSALTFSRVSMVDFYERMDLPAEQIEVMRAYADTQGPLLIASTAIWAVLLIAYLLYIRRFFTAGTVQPEQ